jgi:predicted TIM-barrel fold metal-dependent hydrolase
LAELLHLRRADDEAREPALLDELEGARREPFGEKLTTGLERLPSEQLREHFWFSTQPIEEPDDPEHLAFAFDALGMTDRIMFSTDYPHWDFDAPGQTLPRSIDKPVKEKILAGNACRLYGLGGAETR